jgi:hypothetical protein
MPLKIEPQHQRRRWRDGARHLCRFTARHHLVSETHKPLNQEAA